MFHSDRHGHMRRSYPAVYCPVISCNKYFTLHTNLDAHLAIQHGIVSAAHPYGPHNTSRPKLHCPTRGCTKVCEGYDALASHRAKEHDSFVPGGVLDLQQCPKCYETFQTHLLSQHMSRRHGDKCPSCGKAHGQIACPRFARVKCLKCSSGVAWSSIAQHLRKYHNFPDQQIPESGTDYAPDDESEALRVSRFYSSIAGKSTEQPNDTYHSEDGTIADDSDCNRDTEHDEDCD